MSDDKHTRVRTGLRTAGVVLVGVGGICFVVALVDFFRAFGGSGFPHLFWLAFVGLPLIGIGVWCLIGGFGGKIVDYAAREASPAVRRIVDELRSTPPPASAYCTGCGAAIAPGNQFCGACGRKV